MAEITDELLGDLEKETKKQATIGEMEPQVRAGLNIARVIAKSAPADKRDQYLETLAYVEGRWEAARDNFIELTVHLSSLLRRPPNEIAAAIVQMDENLRAMGLTNRTQTTVSGHA